MVTPAETGIPASYTEALRQSLLGVPLIHDGNVAAWEERGWESAADGLLLDPEARAYIRQEINDTLDRDTDSEARMVWGLVSKSSDDSDPIPVLRLFVNKTELGDQQLEVRLQIATTVLASLGVTPREAIERTSPDRPSGPVSYIRGDQDMLSPITLSPTR